MLGHGLIRERTSTQFVTIALWATVAGAVMLAGQATSDPIAQALSSGELDLPSTGRSFLIREAGQSSFLLIGGLHGDKETPGLVQDLVGALRPAGYGYIATEMSPWAARNLPDTLWGVDIEVVQPHLLIRALAAANPDNPALRSMLELVKDGYRRALAPQMLTLTQQVGDLQDVDAGGTSVRHLLLKSLEVEAMRQNGDSYGASVEREATMKEFFLAHYRAASTGRTPRVIVALGTNHLHRGIDQRGVSTLGNFIAELAAGEEQRSFHVAIFAAGGKVFLGGLQDADQRNDDPAFAFLAALARYPATVFDLRPLRRWLHGMKTSSPRDLALKYWADSYDAIVCYREVTPMTGPGTP